MVSVSALSYCDYNEHIHLYVCWNASSGWDIHDQLYSRELLISNKTNGYRDVIALIDLSTYRRIPWEDNVPFFLVSFLDPETKQPLCACPRNTLKRAIATASRQGWECFAGVEYEVKIEYTSISALDSRIPVFPIQWWFMVVRTQAFKPHWCCL